MLVPVVAIAVMEVVDQSSYAPDVAYADNATLPNMVKIIDANVIKRIVVAMETLNEDHEGDEMDSVADVLATVVVVDVLATSFLLLAEIDETDAPTTYDEKEILVLTTSVKSGTDIKEEES